MKKKTLKQGLAVCLSLFMTINSLSAFDVLPQMVSFASTAQVNATTLNVRSGPGTTYAIAGKLTNGMSVTVLGTTTGSDGKPWNQIRYTDSSGRQVAGYVLSTYLKTPTTYMTNANFESYLNTQGFPESYKDGLRKLHAEYPNWTFTAQHTNLDWETVIQNESIVGRNLVYSSSLSSWKSTADGAYNWDTSTWPGFDSSSYVAASDGIIRYYMDPRNFLDDKYVFQFLTHNYDSGQQTAEGLSEMLKGTFMESEATESGPGDYSGGPGSISGPGVTMTGPGSSSSSSVSTGGPGSASPDSDSSSSVSSSGPGSVGSSAGTAAPGSSGSSVGMMAPGSSGSSVGMTAPGSSGSSVGMTAPGSSGSTAGNAVPGGTGGSAGAMAPGGGNGSGGISFEAPSGSVSGSGGGGVSLQGPTASISKRETNRVATAAGPGSTGSVSRNEIGPGVSSGGSSPASGASYVDILMSAAAQSGVNPYVLAAMILQEQGNQGTGKSISGTVPGYRGYYNFFNIEAYQSGSMDAVSRGLWYASQYGSYQRPWNSVDSSIVGGATYYGTNYVSVGQDTFYLKKFNVQGSNLYKHQYMTNVQAAASEGAKLAEAYGTELKQTALEFKIPVYLNMPETASPKPTGDGSPNNKLSGLGVDGFAITPTFNRDRTSYDLIVDPSVSQVTVNAVPLASTAAISGTGTIQLQSGNNEITVSVKAQNGSVREYQIHVVRQDNGPTHNSSLGSGINGPGGYGPGYSSASAGPGYSSTVDSNTGSGVNYGPGYSTSAGSSSEPSVAGPGGSAGTVSPSGSISSGVITNVAPSSGGSGQTVSGTAPGGGSQTDGSGGLTGPGGSNVTIIR